MTTNDPFYDLRREFWNLRIFLPTSQGKGVTCRVEHSSDQCCGNMGTGGRIGVRARPDFTLLLIPAVLRIADDLKQAASRGLRTLFSGSGSAGLEGRVP